MRIAPDFHRFDQRPELEMVETVVVVAVDFPLNFNTRRSGARGVVSGIAIESRRRMAISRSSCLDVFSNSVAEVFRSFSVDVSGSP